MVPLYGSPTDSSCRGQQRCWWDQRHQGSHLVRRQHQRGVGRVRRMCRESKQSQLGWRCAGSPSSSGWGGESCCRSSTIAAAAVEGMSILVHPPLARLLRFSVWSRWRRVRSTSAGRGMGAKKKPECCWSAATTGGLDVTWLMLLVCKRENRCCVGGAGAEGGKLS